MTEIIRAEEQFVQLFVFTLQTTGPAVSQLSMYTF